MRRRAVLYVAGLAERYREEFLSAWSPKKGDYTKDWYAAFDFLLHHSYFQGRRDELSERFFQQARRELSRLFGDSSREQARYLALLLKTGALPKNPAWSGFKVEESPVYAALRSAKAGKKRDWEMVLDLLRFAASCRDSNVVNFALGELKAGRVESLFSTLQGVWQVGPKIAGFFLRDLAMLYELDSGLAELIAMQPVDTWVRQVSAILGVIDGSETDSVARAKIVQACTGLGISSSDYNAGAWYVGKHALPLLLARV